MGSGHVTFFYDKLDFLTHRYIDLYYECIYRGFKVQRYLNTFMEARNKFKSVQWTPSNEDIQISRDRIQEKIKQRPNFYRYKGKVIQ